MKAERRTDDERYGRLVIECESEGTGTLVDDPKRLVITRWSDSIDLDLDLGKDEVGVRLTPEWARQIGLALVEAAALVRMAEKIDAEDGAAQ